MSGDVIVLQDGPTGHVVGLVRAAGVVAREAGVSIALIGGLAVTCRLAVAHRVTADVDLVADDPSEILAAGLTAAERLLNSGAAHRRNGVVSGSLYIESTKIEIIDTTSQRAEDVSEVEPDAARLFILAHRWALETATSCTIGVSETDVEITVPVATVAALVAMKLHAIQDRSDDRKRASDAWDLFRLLSTHNANGELAAAFDAAPSDLFPLVASALSKVFRQESTRTRSRLLALGEPAWAAVMTEEAMDDLVSDFIQ